MLSLATAVSFASGLVTAIAGEIPRLDPKSQARLQEDGYVYAADGKTLLALLRGDESRIVVGSDEIAPVVKQAIVAVEDRRFWEHRGVDVRGIVRAIWADIRHSGLVQGGSTITQQFVKNTYRKNDRTIGRKLREAALAWQLERRWSKDRILTAYLNTVYFGNGAYGIEVAARVYFHKHAQDLTLAEAALLAGIPADPAAYDPVTRPRAAGARRATVLRVMHAQELITAGELRRALAAPLPRPRRIGLRRMRGVAPYFVEYVKQQQLIPYYGAAKVFGGGLRITTSIDLELQKLAQRAIRRWLDSKRGPAAALVAVDPRDGRVLALVGGENFKRSQFNLAAQGRRQAGSAFKPFVLATALAEGISPRTTYESKPTLIDAGGRVWSVRNYEDSYLGEIDLETATTYSDNAVYAQLTAQVGPANVRRMAHALGVTSPLHAWYAIGLGAEGVTPLEMARAFASFADGGARVDGAVLGNVPRAVLRVEDGDRVDENAPRRRQVLDPNDAAIVTSMLERVVEQGTGERARLADRPAAGKTGTTENYGDAWFVGYTPQLAVAVWVGYPNRLVPMTTEFQGGPVAGGTYPALIWKTFVERALAKLKEAPTAFPVPRYEPSIPVRVVHRHGKSLLDNGNCRDAREVAYVVGRQPTEQAACKPNEVDVPRLVGARLEDAVDRLESTPLVPEVITRPARRGERLGRVVAQYPASGTLSSFATVRVVVPKPIHGVVPRVTGLPVLKARTKLARRGLLALVAAVTEDRAGLVVGQSPRPGVAASPGMPVKLVVARG